MRIKLMPLVLCAFAVSAASAVAFPSLQEFLSQLKEQSAVETPSAAPADGKLIPVGGTVMGHGAECKLIARHADVCTYHCDALYGIQKRPVDRTVPSGCYDTVILSSLAPRG